MIQYLLHNEIINLNKMASYKNFAGDYSPVRTSLIGALYYNLGVSVGGLSKNKQEDLRKLFYCWWSHPLPDNIPYRYDRIYDSFA